MSGGVGVTGGSDITLPSPTSSPSSAVEAAAPPKATAAARRLHYHLVSFKQLNTLSAMALLALSTAVPPSHFAFAVLSLPYLLLLSSPLAFPPTAPSASASPVILGAARRLVAAWTAAGFLLGVLLPALYILVGLRAGDAAGVAAAAPHAFLLAAQVFAEGLVAAFPSRFSLPMRAFVPVLYNSLRMFALAQWAAAETGRREGAAAGWVLAAANLGFWGVNLFGFLLPVYLPRVLKRYYCEPEEMPRDGAKEEVERKKAS